MNKKRFWLFHLIIFLSILHLWEEWATKIYLVDPIAKLFGNLIGGTPEIAFYLAELAMFIFIGALLLLFLSKRKLPTILLFILSLASIFEFEHLIEAFRTGGYYPGLWSGAALGIAGLFLFVDLLRKK